LKEAPLTDVIEARAKANIDNLYRSNNLNPEKMAAFKMPKAD